jgi:hypothetical protein
MGKDMGTRIFLALNEILVYATQALPLHNIGHYAEFWLKFRKCEFLIEGFKIRAGIPNHQAKGGSDARDPIQRM